MITLPSGTYIVPTACISGGSSEAEPGDLQRFQTDCARTDSQRFLTGAERTTGQLRKKVLSLGYSAAVAENTVEWAVKYRFTDDIRFCRMFISSRPMGRIRLRFELLNRGAAEEAVEKILEEHSEEDDFPETVKKVARRYGNLRDRETAVRRAAGWLSRRGYSGGFIHRVIKEAL